MDEDKGKLRCSLAFTLMLAIRRSFNRSLSPRQLTRSLVLASVIGKKPQRIRSFATTLPALRAIAIDLPLSAMTYPAAPQAPPAWNYTPDQIKSAVQRSISDSSALLDEIAALSPADCTFASVFQRLARHEGQEANLELPVFLQYVSTDKAIRDEAVQGDKLLQVRSHTRTSHIHSVAHSVHFPPPSRNSA